MLTIYALKKTMIKDIKTFLTIFNDTKLKKFVIGKI